MPTTPIAAPTPRFDSFYKHDELTKLLFEYAQAFPSLAAIRSIGRLVGWRRRAARRSSAMRQRVRNHRAIARG